MQHVVTVTCLEDREQLLLQVASIERYLEPCTHWIIVNEDSLDGWDVSYTRHTVKLLLAPKWPTCSRWANTGWKTQQLVKLWIYSQIKDSYLILDSKNLFIRACNLTAWTGLYGCGVLENYAGKHSSWGDTIRAYSQHIGVEVTLVHASMQTPFVIDHRVMSAYNWETLLPWFNDCDSKPSEFLLYSILAQALDYKGKLKQQHRTLWPHSGDFNPGLWDDPRILVAGLHRQYLADADLWAIGCWLNSIGL